MNITGIRHNPQVRFKSSSQDDMIRTADGAVRDALGFHGYQDITQVFASERRVRVTVQDMNRVDEVAQKLAVSRGFTPPEGVKPLTVKVGIRQMPVDVNYAGRVGH